MKLAGEGRSNRKRLVLAIVAAAVIFGYYLLSQKLGHLDLHNLLEEVSNTLGAWTYLLVGVFAFAETGAFVGLVVPGETVMLLGGAVAGQGAIDVYLLIADRLVRRLGGRHDQLLHRPPPRPRVRPPTRPPLRDRPRALREGRGLLLPPRRQDDLHRPLHQPRPRLRAVHRRQLGDALPRLRPLQHPRHRALGQRPHPDRLLLLAQHRHRRQVRRQRGVPARHADRRRRRHGRPRPPLPGRGEPARGGPLDGGPRGDPLARRPRPPLPAPAPLPLGPGHTRRDLRVGVHLADGDPRRRPLRADRLRGRRRRRTGPDARRRDRDGSRRKPPHGLADRRREGLHRSRLGGGDLGPCRRLRRLSGRAPALGRARGPGRRDDADHRSASRRSRWRSTVPVRPIR